jgi:glycerol-3-phosphate dehydrogenase (NAD(P)+)
METREKHIFLRKIRTNKNINGGTHSMAKIGIIGAGSWGIALSVLLHNNGHEITVWSAIESEIEMLKTEHEQKDKLPGVKLAVDMIFTTELSEAVKGKDILVLAVPSTFTRSTAKKMKELVADKQIIVNVAKGIEEATLMTLSQIIEEEIPQADVAVLSGPSHAEEVGRGIPTTIVVGANTKETAEYIQNIFMSNVFRVYTSPDVLGIELGAALKNVVALAAGIADGLGYGDNTKAALITRGIHEIARLGGAMGAKFETFCGLSGIGDLIVTCASMHSRNRRAGILIGQGKTMEEAMAEVKMVVEGVYSAKAAMGLAKKYNVELPIIEQVNEILFNGKDASTAVKDLMLRDKKIEVAHIEVTGWN